MTEHDFDIIAGVLYRRRENAWNLDKLNWSGNDITVAISIIDDTANFMGSELGNQYDNFDRKRFDKICTEGRV